MGTQLPGSPSPGRREQTLQQYQLCQPQAPVPSADPEQLEVRAEQKGQGWGLCAGAHPCHPPRALPAPAVPGFIPHAAPLPALVLLPALELYFQRLWGMSCV